MSNTTNTRKCETLHTTNASELLVCTRTKGHDGSHTDTTVAGTARVWPRT